MLFPQPAKHVNFYGSPGAVSYLYFFFHRLELTKTLILPELVELTRDEQLVVRQAGIQTVSNILNLLDDGKFFSCYFPMN